VTATADAEKVKPRSQKDCRKARAACDTAEATLCFIGPRSWISAPTDYPAFARSGGRRGDRSADGRDALHWLGKTRPELVPVDLDLSQIDRTVRNSPLAEAPGTHSAARPGDVAQRLEPRT